MEAELLSARFSVRWEERGGGDRGEGPQDVTLDEALAWAREHATVVYLILGDVRYSAGSERRDDDASILSWPEEGMVVRPRPPGTPLDGSVQSRPWALRAWMSVPTRGVSEATTARLRDELARDERVGAVAVSRLEDDGIEVRFEVASHAAGAAMRMTDLLLTDALARAGVAGAVTRVQYAR